MKSGRTSFEVLEEELSKALERINELENALEESRRNGDALRHSENRYRSLFEASSDSIFIVDTQTKAIVAANHAASSLYGYSAEEFLKMIHTEVSAEPEKTDSAVSDSVKNVPYRLHLKRDGTVFPVEITGNYFEESGRLMHTAFVRDITHRRQNEEDLRIFKESLENATDAIGISTPQGRHYYQNKAFDDLFGFIGEDPPASLYVDRRTGDEVFKTIMSGGQWTGEVQMYSKDKHVLEIYLRAYANKDEAGNITALVGIHTDITERKRTERLLEISQKLFSAAFYDSPALMVITDAESGKTIDANKAAVALTGYSYDEVIGLSAMELDFMSPEDRSSFAQEVLEKGFVTQREIGFRTRNGDNRVILYSGRLVEVEDRLCILSHLNDITEKRRVEEQLRNLLKHSQDVRERERARVAREIHDELGQVLTALKMDLSYLARKLPPVLTDLSTKTNLMLRFVDMTIQSVKRITMDLRPGLLDHLGLVAAIEWQADDFQKRTGIRCRISVTPEEIILEPDQSTTVFRILQETLTNVAKYAHATEVRISLKEQGGMFEMTVVDNGVGISKDQMADPKSFGLMGIQERAYFSGGTARIFGEKGKGTTVEVTIPIDQMRGDFPTEEGDVIK